MVKKIFGIAKTKFIIEKYALVCLRCSIILTSGPLKLTLAEKDAISIFLIVEEDLQANDSDEESSFLNSANDEFEGNIKRAKKNSPYRSLLHISPTSNIVERLFSRTGIIMRPHRRLMDPSTLEMLVLLRFNRDLWSERDLDTIMTRSRASANP